MGQILRLPIITGAQSSQKKPQPNQDRSTGKRCTQICFNNQESGCALRIWLCNKSVGLSKSLVAIQIKWKLAFVLKRKKNNILRYMLVMKIKPFCETTQIQQLSHMKSCLPFFSILPNSVVDLFGLKAFALNCSWKPQIYISGNCASYLCIRPFIPSNFGIVRV